MLGSDPSEASQEMLFKDSETEKPSAYLVHGHMRTFFVSILLLDGYEVEYDGSNEYPSAMLVGLSYRTKTTHLTPKCGFGANAPESTSCPL